MRRLVVAKRREHSRKPDCIRDRIERLKGGGAKWRERLYDGVASFGRRPMFDAGTVLLEVFLFDFSGDLYGEMIDVAFVDWIRPELKFDNVEGLVRRMHEDAKLARTALTAAPDAFPKLGPVAG